MRRKRKGAFLRDQRAMIWKGIGVLCGCMVWAGVILAVGFRGSGGRMQTPKEIWLYDHREESGGMMDPSDGEAKLQEIPSEIMDDLYSPYGVLIDGTSGEVLAGRYSQDRIYPASMTKMMTAIVALENTDDWEERIVLPTEIYGVLYAEHASVAGFEAGEKVLPMDMLYGMLLPSGAECCLGYAWQLAGNEKNFVEWMNEKADALEMTGTHFANTTGLPDEDHYSTVEDMAVLLRYCLQNESFREILTAQSHRTAPTNVHPKGLDFTSTLLGRLEGGKQVKGAQILGGKTGYTSKAGLCLASVARIGDREYILVTAGAPGTNYAETYHIEDAVAVYGRLAEFLEGSDLG